MMRLLSILFWAGFFFLGGNSFVAAQSTNSVMLEVQAPFSYARLTVEDTGIAYTANAPDSGINEINGSAAVSPEQYRDLLSLIDRSQFFFLQDEYREENLADATAYIVTVKEEGREKSVTCYGEGCPESVTEIINAIKILWGKDILEIGI